MLLQLSAIVYGLLGAALIFAPDEIANRLVLSGNPVTLQVLGAAVFGFAMLNWMSRGTRIGGIYGRPLVVANLTHASVATLSLLRPAIRGGGISLLIPLAVYAVLAVAFGSRLYTHPK